MNHPITIGNPTAFDAAQWHITCPYCSREIGFDGIFHWGWVLDAIGYTTGKTKIQPMDFDGVIERRSHYLVFETKDVHASISQAQQWTLERLNQAKSFTVMKVWGKEQPAQIEIEDICNGKPRKAQGYGTEEAKRWVQKWFAWANSH